jgi:hypothetical protein
MSHCLTPNMIPATTPIAPITPNTIPTMVPRSRPPPPPANGVLEGGVEDVVEVGESLSEREVSNELGVAK